MFRIKPVFILIAVSCFIVTAFAGTIIVDFHAQSGFNIVTLKWTSQNEINLKGFEVERSLESSTGDFKKLDFVQAITDQQEKKAYIFEDKSVFKSSARTFYYRLKIVDEDGTSSYSKIISVSPTISSVRQTWGSIKAMFR